MNIDNNVKIGNLILLEEKMKGVYGYWYCGGEIAKDKLENIWSDTVYEYTDILTNEESDSILKLYKEA